MKIGRILHDGREIYGIRENSSFKVFNCGRDNLGREEFLYSGFDYEIIEILSLKDIDFSWLPPIARPGKILCIGRNYAEHSKEQGKEPEGTPLIFSKFVTSLTGHNTSIQYPSHTSNLDYEVELAVVIGKEAKQLTSDDDPWDYIFGYSIANDLTARDVQKSEKQWTRAKGFDQALPFGPHIVTHETIDRPTNNEIWLTVNGEKRQLSTTDKMIFGIDYLIKYISQTITLEPGDIILTGTPEGVGYYMDPKGVLQRGDQVSCGVVNIGELRFSIQ